MPQIKAMFTTFKMVTPLSNVLTRLALCRLLVWQVSGGETVTQAMEKDGCSHDFIRCVTTLSSCMLNSGRYFAKIVHDTMNASNKEFVNLLLARSEVQFPSLKYHLNILHTMFTTPCSLRLTCRTSDGRTSVITTSS